MSDVITGASAATYDSTNNYITFTLSTGADAPVLKKASVLATEGIYGIEPYSAT